MASETCAAIAVAVVAAAALGLPPGAAAQLPETQSFQVLAEVVDGCALVGSGQTSGLDFGILDFGSAPSVVAADLSASATTGEAATEIWCTPGLAMQVAVDAGQHASGSQRMLAGGGGGLVPYALFVDTGHSIAIPTTGSISVTAPAGGVIDLPIHGVASVPGGSLMPGTYTDTLQVTLTW